jgi:hypothetical protein
MINHSLAISTFFPPYVNPLRLTIFQTSICSLIESGYDGYIFICDDGSSTYDHLDFIYSLHNDKIVVYKQGENRGYSKIKNLGIKLILDQNNEFGFLCDDDLLYKKDWWTYYLDAYEKTGYPHYSFFNHTYGGQHDLGTLFEKNGIDLRLTPLLQGGMLTFSSTLINQVGYYKIFPRKLGHEHTNFTVRIIHKNIIPGFLDLRDSMEYLSHVEESVRISTVPNDYQEQIIENGVFVYTDLDRIEPCIF